MIKKILEFQPVSNLHLSEEADYPTFFCVDSSNPGRCLQRPESDGVTRWGYECITSQGQAEQNLPRAVECSQSP